MNQINSRHNFLDGFLGTKPEEDISHAQANKVNLWITLTTSLCCVLEIVLYFVYNRMVISKSRCLFVAIPILDPSMVANHKWR